MIMKRPLKVKIYELLIDIYKNLPLSIRKHILVLLKYINPVQYKGLKENYKRRKELIDYLEIKQNEVDEGSTILNFIKKNHNIELPYDFIKKYETKNIQVYNDLEYGMMYVLHNNKKLYFPKEFNMWYVLYVYNGLLKEQDIDSPHLYETSSFHVRDGDVIVDVGAAEGIFTLNNIEKVKKAYLFECEKKWIEAMEITFKPWKEKVTIIKKYVSDITDDSSITLDDFVESENIKNINFIKADIEGAEIKLISGSNKLLSKQSDLQVILCTYHNQNDAEEINKSLKEFGFQTEFSKGYMIFMISKFFSPPYLRKGIIRATK